MTQTGAFVTGLVGGPLGYLGTELKHRLGYDDALDAVGVHAVGGAAGTLLAGLFADDLVTARPAARGALYGRPVQLALQLYGVAVIAG